MDTGLIIDTDCQGIRSFSLLSTLPNSAFTPEEDFDDGDEQAEPVQRLVQEMSAWSLEDVGCKGVGRE